jgi:hypothetical protein
VGSDLFIRDCIMPGFAYVEWLGGWGTLP